MNTTQKESLKSKLDSLKLKFNQNASEKKKEVYKNGIEKVRKSGILEKAIKKGDRAKDFTLTNATGKKVSLYKVLETGPVILTWYRGGWCPYCNITLHHLQEKIPEFKMHNATLMALTPEIPDKSISTKEKHNLQFEVLTDPGNKVAREYGIVYKLDEKVSEFYKESFSLKEYNGDDSDELPLAATYIIKMDGTIAYAFLDADYRNRAEPDELIEVLKGL